jgi:hypothetical protein
MRQKHRKARNTLIIGAAAFVCLQVGFGIATEMWWPRYRDPEYGNRLRLLKSRLASTSPSFTLVMLGSSRTLRGFRPDVVEQSLARTVRTPVVAFNFGLTGAGPLLEMLTLRRLLAEGIRPDFLLIEVLPALYQESNPATAASGIALERLWHQDLPYVVRYGASKEESRRQWWQAILFPSYSSRYAILSQLAPWLVPYDRRMDWVCKLDETGWLTNSRTTATDEERRHGQEYARKEYKERLQELHPGGLSSRILCDLLELCRSENIPAALVVMPEGPLFRSWYPPSAWPEFQEFLKQLERDFAIHIINAREWIGEKDFIDSHHLMADGARVLSAHLASETIPMLLEQPAFKPGDIALNAPGHLPFRTGLLTPR